MDNDLRYPPMTIPRSHRWTAGSFRAAHIAGPQERTSLVATLQALGRLDEALTRVDALCVAGDGYITSEDGIMAFDAHLTQSYLWVLGAYEIVRVLHERSRVEKVVSDRHLDGLYRSFTRLRVPLAKFEPAGKHRETDGHMAYPALNPVYGIAWQVAENTFIARGELSDGLLQYLESLPPIEH